MRVRRDSVRRANAAAAVRAIMGSDSERRAAAPATRRSSRADPQDLMMLSDSLANKPSAEPEPPSLPQPSGP